MEHLELPDDGYSSALAPEMAVGDVCVAIPFVDPAGVLDAFTFDGLRPGELLLKACWTRAIVLRLFAGCALLAPISTAVDGGDPEQFETVVGAGSGQSGWIRLPPLVGEWDEPAVALLFQPQTLPADYLIDRRAASLHEDARRVFAQLVAKWFGVIEDPT